MARLEAYASQGTAKEWLELLEGSEEWHEQQGRAPGEKRFRHEGGAVARIFPNVTKAGELELQADNNPPRFDFFACYAGSDGTYPAPFSDLAGHGDDDAADDDASSKASGADDTGADGPAPVRPKRKRRRSKK